MFRESGEPSAGSLGALRSLGMTTHDAGS
jgi:hypothetical protein